MPGNSWLVFSVNRHLHFQLSNFSFSFRFSVRVRVLHNRVNTSLGLDRLLKYTNIAFNYCILFISVDLIAF